MSYPLNTVNPLSITSMMWSMYMGFWINDIEPEQAYVKNKLIRHPWIEDINFETGMMLLFDRPTIESKY